MLTAAGDDSRPAALFEARGATVDRVQLISIGPPPDEAALNATVRRANAFDWIAFSSATGVAAFAERSAAPPGVEVRLAALGPATAEAVHSVLGRRADLVPERYESEGLAEAFERSGEHGASILLLQAQDARPVLASRLEAAGFSVTAVAAYSTLATPPRDLAARVERAHAIVLASASAARALALGLAPNAQSSLRDKVIACIGPVTAAQARALGIRVDVVPEKSTMAGVAEALCGWYEKKNRS
jgi:uroporphyrinogen-III synthase